MRKLGPYWLPVPSLTGWKLKQPAVQPSRFKNTAFWFTHCRLAASDLIIRKIFSTLFCRWIAEFWGPEIQTWRKNTVHLWRIILSNGIKPAAKSCGFWQQEKEKDLWWGMKTQQWSLIYNQRTWSLIANLVLNYGVEDD